MQMEKGQEVSVLQVKNRMKKIIKKMVKALTFAIFCSIIKEVGKI